MQDDLEMDIVGADEATDTEQPEQEAPPAQTGEEVDAPVDQPTEPELVAPPVADPIEKRLQGLQSAKAEETKRRQAAELEAARLRGMLEARQTQSQQPEPEVEKALSDEFWENPGKFIESAAERKARAIVRERDTFSLAASEARVSARVEGYKEKQDIFLGYIEQHPEQKDALYRQILASPEPAQAMVDMVTRYQQAQQSSQQFDPGWLAKKEAEIRARVEAELRGEKAKQAVASAPKTQAGVRGSGVALAPDGDPLDELQTY